MPKQRQADVLRISTPGDMVCALTHMLGFVPVRSLGVLCTHGPRQRLGLALRFDLDPEVEPGSLAAAVEARAVQDGADGVFLVVFADDPPVDGEMPFDYLVGPLDQRIGDLMLDMLLVVGDRCWSYLCNDASCCPPQGNPVDSQSPGAISLAAAYALRGKAVLDSREAVVASIAYAGDPEQAAALRKRIEAEVERSAPQLQAVRRLAVRGLLSRLSGATHDPRYVIPDQDIAALVALCEDVVVRDEVLVRARKPARRRNLLRVLTQVVRRVPPPYDAPLCATLAMIAHAHGDGVIASVAVDRALATDPDYSLARLVDDALARQVPPRMLEEVMTAAARDLAQRP
jgi:hypothetical protein